ncbi:transposase [Aquimarina sp. I32.4]|uniref:transposase n=1 Tax=Aquimarina sp. I32.4 TaxID=2053903 RepID=UPI0011AF3488|nr:transposase [Aquimarina sp. I32.4]
MVKRKHSNDFKLMIVELLQSGQSVQQVSSEYDLDGSMMDILWILTPILVILTPL